MSRIIELARYIINYCIDNDFELDTKRLENILIILQGAYLNRYDTKLFSDKIFVKSGNVYIANFENNRFLFNQKSMIFLTLTDEEQKLIQDIMKDILEGKINIYLFYNTSFIISVLSENEIIQLFIGSYN